MSKLCVVVGGGMVAHRFVEAMRSRDTADEWRVTVLAEEADAAYDRVVSGDVRYSFVIDTSTIAV